MNGGLVVEHDDDLLFSFPEGRRSLEPVSVIVRIPERSPLPELTELREIHVLAITNHIFTFMAIVIQSLADQIAFEPDLAKPSDNGRLMNSGGQIGGPCFICLQILRKLFGDQCGLYSADRNAGEMLSLPFGQNGEGLEQRTPAPSRQVVVMR